MIDKNIKMQLVCFSHLSWKFVYQRPQHILSRFTKKYSMYYIEEFVYSSEADGFSKSITDDNVIMVVPHLNNNTQGESEIKRLEAIIKILF